MSSLVRIKTEWPEEGSAWSTAARARWMAARWSRAERKVSKRPADAKQGAAKVHDVQLMISPK
eukprot:756759-Pleurochrysis_carterae.AAC.1